MTEAFGGADLLGLEDEPDTTANVVGRLHEFGHRVLSAHNLESAIVRSKGGRFQGIMLDQRFSTHSAFDGRAGLEFIRALKSGLFGEMNRDVPFVVLTSYPHEVPVAEYLNIQGFCGPILSKLSVDAIDVCAALGLLVPGGAKPDEFWVDDLLEVHEPANAAGRYYFYVPAWSHGEGVEVSAAILPEDVRVELEWGVFPAYVWAQVNIDAVDARAVSPREFRMSLDSDEGLASFYGGRL